MTRWLADFLLLNERDDELIVKMQTTEDDEVDEWIEKKERLKRGRFITKGVLIEMLKLGEIIWVTKV